MLQYLLAIVVGFTLLACTNGTKKPDAPERYGWLHNTPLYGDVKQVEIHIYNNERDFEEVYHFNINGDVVQVSDALSYTYHYFPNGNCREVQCTDHGRPWSSYQKKFSYNAHGHKSKEVRYDNDKNELGTTAYTYDADGRLIQESDYTPVSSPVSYTYDAAGNLSEKVCYYDSNGKVWYKTTYAYDPAGNCIEECLFNAKGGLESKSTYLYDKEGNQIEVNNYGPLDELAWKSSYTYDSYGNIIEEITTGEVEQRIIYQITYRSESLKDVEAPQYLCDLAKEWDLTDRVETWYEQATTHNNAAAQCLLGVLHHDGEGIAQDLTEACAWYHKAAEQGHPLAQNNLGYCYQQGQGVTQDLTTAVIWYRKAAEQGLPEAQNNLGKCYKSGEGVPKNYQVAFQWYMKAAEQGHAGAQNNVGVCFYEGKGVPRSFTTAKYWYRKAIEQGNETAKLNLEILEEEGY